MTEKTKGVLSLVGIAFVWSLMAMLPRYLSTSFLLFQQIYLRFLFALVLTAAIFYRRINYAKFFTLTGREVLPIFLRALFYYLLGVSLFTQAVLITKISNVSFIGALPLMAVLGVLIFKEKLTFKKLLLMGLAFVGAVIISVTDWNNIFRFGFGELLAFISAVFINLGMLARKWESKKLNNAETSIAVIFFAFVLVLATSIVSGEVLPLSGWSLGSVMALLLAGLLNAGLVNLMSYGMKRVAAVLASNLLQLEVPLTVILALFFYREVPALKDLFGGSLIFTAAYLMNRLEAKSI